MDVHLDGHAGTVGMYRGLVGGPLDGVAPVIEPRDVVRWSTLGW